MAQPTTNDSLETRLNAFASFYKEFLDLRSMDALELAIGDAEARIESQPNLPRADCIALLDGVLSASKQTRRELAADISELHRRVALVFLGLETHGDDVAGLLSQLRRANLWLVELQVTITTKAPKRDVERYFAELDRMRAELLKIADGSEDIAQTLNRALENERKVTRQLEKESLKLEKTEEKYRKAKTAFEDLKTTYSELFKRHEALLKQNAMLKDQVTSRFTSWPRSAWR